MTRRRRCASVFLVAFVCIALMFASAGAATTGTLSARLTNEFGSPVADARVVLSSATAMFLARSDADGRVTFDSVPFDTYRVAVEATGYEVYTLESVIVTADKAIFLAVALRQQSKELAEPPHMNGKKAVPNSHHHHHQQQQQTAAAQQQQQAAESVHDSLLGLFNESHPVHMGDEPYYGRYSYVLLRDGDEAEQAKNRAFVTKLVDHFAASGSTIAFGSASRTDSPLSYNVFFFPVNEGTPTIKVVAHAGAAETILDAYDFGKASDLRVAYCAVPAHVDRSLCHVPYSGGPVLLTFLRPLSTRLASAKMPPAFAYDFAQVSADQFDGPLDTVQRKIEVSSAITADAILPPPLAAHVANELELLASALNAGLTGVRVWIDSQPGATHGLAPKGSR